MPRHLNTAEDNSQRANVAVISVCEEKQKGQESEKKKWRNAIHEWTIDKPENSLFIQRAPVNNHLREKTSEERRVNESAHNPEEFDFKSYSPDKNQP